MKRWIHLLSGVAIAATVAHYATLEAVRHDHRPAPGGWKSRDDPRSLVPPSPGHDGRSTERTDSHVVRHRDLLLEPGVVALNDNPVDRLRRSGLI